MVTTPTFYTPDKLRRTNVPTYNVSVYIGSRRGYKGPTFTKTKLVREIAFFQKLALSEQVEICSVNVSECDFVVGDYQEPGFKIEAINYPRFPKTPTRTVDFMTRLSGYLMSTFEQNRMTMVTPLDTIMLTAPGAEDHP